MATQTVTDPRFYTQSDLTFSSSGITLAGTLTVPNEQVRGAAVILPGSGDVDRDSNHKRIPLGVSRDLAHALAARGVASLRYDKRGVGASGGRFLETGLSDNIDDANAALDEVRRQYEGLPLIIIGHSEGAMIAEAVAADADDLAGVVLLAGPGTVGEETMKWQARQVANALPAFARFVTTLMRVDIIDQQRKAIDKIKATTGDTARIQGRTINAKWQRELLAFDPAQYLSRIQAPVLAITGGKDLQVTPMTSRSSPRLSRAPSRPTDPRTSRTCCATTPACRRWGPTRSSASSPWTRTCSRRSRTGSRTAPPR